MYVCNIYCKLSHHLDFPYGWFYYILWTRSIGLVTTITIMPLFITYQIFLLTRDWSKYVTWLNIPQLKLGNNCVIFPNFQNCACCKKHLNDNKHNSLHLVEKYAQIFVPGHYLFLKAHSFPWGTLSENCLLLGTDNVHGQIPVHIFCDKWRLLFI